MGLTLSSIYIRVNYKLLLFCNKKSAPYFHDLPVVSLIKPTHNTFVELILIKRIIFIDHQQHKTQSISFDILVEYHMDNVIDKKEYQQYSWLLKLLFKYSLKEYFDLFYIDSHCIMIDLIFKHIVLTHYKNQYSKHTTLTISPTAAVDHDSSHNHNINYCQCLVFNQHDLIPYAFQYLDLLSLNQCSKVNFLWLFHSYNINSLYIILILIQFLKIFVTMFNGIYYLQKIYI